jgi:hypothetical protein
MTLLTTLTLSSYLPVSANQSTPTISQSDISGNGDLNGKANTDDNDSYTNYNATSQAFWINKWDQTSHFIPVTKSRNALKVSSRFTFHQIDDFMPKMTAVWGDYARDYNLKQPNSYNSTNSINTQPVNFTTQWFLPRGFNANAKEHGNYQGMVMAKNSIYMVESLGTGANQGAIVRLDLSALHKMGLDPMKNQGLLVKAFKYFDAFSATGSNHSIRYVHFLNQMENIKTKLQLTQRQMNAKSQIIKRSQVKIKQNYKKYTATMQQLKKRHKGMTKKTFKARRKATLKNYKKIQKQQKAILKAATKQLANLKQSQNQLSKKQTKLTAGKKWFNLYTQLSHSITASPLINIGHGQTLAYNPKNKHLYLAQDNQLGQVSNHYYNQITELNSDTMKPVHQYRFRLMHNGQNMALHTLTFDAAGHAYFGVHAGPKGTKNVYSIYTGTLNSHRIRFTPVPQLINWPGSYNQYLAYNRHNDRIYMISNDVITSVPTRALRAGTLTSQDVHYVTFDSQREFESLAFDDQGNGYLLALWRAELLRSNHPMD